MRRLADKQRIQALMGALGAEARSAARVYFTGGATAVLLGWRPSTIDADILIVPEADRLLQEIPKLKESLELNVELACPADFIPELPGWADRSPFIGREGPLSFHHYDLYAQALAKLERAHRQDLLDVTEMLNRGLIDPQKVMGHFEAIQPWLYRYPSIDPRSFRKAVVEWVGKGSGAR